MDSGSGTSNDPSEGGRNIPQAVPHALGQRDLYIGLPEFPLLEVTMWRNVSVIVCTHGAGRHGQWVEKNCLPSTKHLFDADSIIADIYSSAV